MLERITSAAAVTLLASAKVAKALQEADRFVVRRYWLQFEGEALAEVEFIEADVWLTAELLDEVECEFLHDLALTAD